MDHEPVGFLPRVGAWLFGPQVKRLREQIGRTHWLSYLLIIAQSVAVVLVFGHAEVPLLFSASLAVRAFAVMTLFVLIATVVAADIALPETIIRVAPLARNRQSGMLGEHLAYVLFILATEGVTYGVVLMKVDGDPQSLISSAPLIPTSGLLFLALVVMRVVLICWSAVQLIIVRAKLPVLLSTLMNTSKEIVGAHVEQQLKEMDVRHIPVRATFNVYARMTQAPRPVAGLFNGWAVRRALAREAEEARQVENIRAALAELNAYSVTDTAPVPTPQPMPLPTPQTPATTASAAARALSNHDLRRLRLQRDMQRDLETQDTDDDDWGAYSGADDLGAYDDDLPRLRQPHVTTPRASFSNHASANHGSAAPARIAPRYSEMTFDLPEGKTERKSDTPEAKRVLRYLDKHPGATIPELMKGAKVSKPTARRYYTSWIERNNRPDVAIAPFTEEMPIVLPESLTSQADELAESM